MEFTTTLRRIRAIGLVAVAVVLGVSAAAQAATDAPLEFEQTHVDVGKAQIISTARVTFRFTNVSESPVVIEKIQTSCGCTVASLPEAPVAPHAASEISADIRIGRRVGVKQTRRLFAHVKGQEEPIILSATVESAELVRITHLRSAGTAAADPPLTIEAVDGSEFRVIGIEPPLLIVPTDPQSVHVLDWNLEASSRRLEGLRIQTDLPGVPEVLIRQQESSAEVRSRTDPVEPLRVVPGHLIAESIFAARPARIEVFIGTRGVEDDPKAADVAVEAGGPWLRPAISEIAEEPGGLRVAIELYAVSEAPRSVRESIVIRCGSRRHAKVGVRTRVY